MSDSESDRDWCTDITVNARSHLTLIIKELSHVKPDDLPKEYQLDQFETRIASIKTLLWSPLTTIENYLETEHTTSTSFSRSISKIDKLLHEAEYLVTEWRKLLSQLNTVAQTSASGAQELNT